MKEPSPSPFHFFFFCSSSNFRAVTRLETLATQATKYKNQLMNEILLNKINGHYDMMVHAVRIIFRGVGLQYKRIRMLVA